MPWRMEKVERRLQLLIDSIFNNIDIGKFAFIHLDYKKWDETGYGYEILDGKQRLNAIIEFYENRFPYKGVYYNDLSGRDKRIFKNHSIVQGEVSETERKDVLKYFLMLNRTGKVMDQKHLDNEEENVVPLSEALIDMFAKDLPMYDYEILFIDNDSKDTTRVKLRQLCENNTKIKAIFNAKNFGQFNSPYYGILQTTGDCTIPVCADFQDPIDVIPRLVKKWEEGYKIVCAVKSSSKER